MDHNFKFNVGDKVKFKVNNGATGVIKQRKYEYTECDKITTELRKYLVHSNSYVNLWYDEEKLQHFFEFVSDIDEGIKQLMIDINLKERNFEMVKYWSEQ